MSDYDPKKPTQKEVLADQMRRSRLAQHNSTDEPPSPPPDPSGAPAMWTVDHPPLASDLSRETIIRETTIRPFTPETPDPQPTPVTGHDPLPKNWIEAVPIILFGFYGLAFAFSGVEAMNRGDVGVAVADTAGCIVCAAIALAWWKRRDWLPQKLVASTTGVITDARWLLAGLSALLIISALAPYVEERRWPYGDWFRPPQPPVVDIRPASSGFTQQQVDEKIAAATKSLEQDNAKTKDELAAVKRQLPSPLMPGTNPPPHDPYPPDPILQHSLTPKDARLMHDMLNELTDVVVQSQKNIAPTKFFLIDRTMGGRAPPWNQNIKTFGFDAAISSLSQYQEQLKTFSDAIASTVSSPVYLNADMQRIVGHPRLDELQNGIGGFVSELQELKRLNIPLEAQFIGEHLYVSADNLSFVYRDFVAWSNSFPWRRVPAAQKEIEPYLNAR